MDRKRGGNKTGTVPKQKEMEKKKEGLIPEILPDEVVVVPAADEDQKNDEQEEEVKKERELSTLSDFIEEVKRRNAWKSELRKTNENVESRPEESDFHKLDSSLKKNTAFVRKLKNFTEGQAASIRKDMSTLNLTKYIGEVAAALVEAKLKLTELSTPIEICSFLHQRYAEFAEHLMESWLKVLTIKKDEKIPNPSKLRVDIRFYSDLVAVGVFTLKKGLPLLGQILTNLVAIDKEEHGNISLILAFCKYCGDDYAGLIPRKILTLSDKYSYEVPQSKLLAPEKQKNVKQMLKDYYQSVCKHLLSDYRELQAMEKLNRRILLTKGELHVERKEKAEALALSYQKLLLNSEQLSDILDEDMPELTWEDPKKSDDGDDEENDCDEAVESSALGQLWEDEETKSFYEDLVDLKAFIPAILYKESSSAGNVLPEEKADEGAEEIEGELEEGGPDEDEEIAPPDLEDEPEEVGTVQNTSAKMLLDAFLSQLPSCIGREMIDNAAAEFCMNHNTKNNRKKLVKNLFAVQRNRQDLLPFFSRLVATLYPCMPEIAVDLAQYLKQDFKWLVRKKDQMKIESKLKCVRFIGEMVKFKMFLKSEALFCMKMLLFDFSHHHIEMACALMESAGRFLYRSPESHRRAKIYLDSMMRKKTALSLDNRYAMMIENAFYNVNPPEVPLQANVAKVPLHEYVYKLIYHDLCKNNTEKVLKQIRKLDWKDDEVAAFGIKAIGSIWNVKYYNIRYAASVLAGLAFYHEWVGHQVIDGILEDIRFQMELNDPKQNQRRTSVVKFLGELYNYRLVDSALIFKVLYSLITFGAPIYPDEPNFLDPPSHLLRIRLVCVILDTCGIYFNMGSSKKKLDYYIIFFQRYYWRKRADDYWKSEIDVKFPFGIKNLVDETLPDLRPKAKFATSLEEAEEAAAKVEKEMISQIREKAPEISKYFDDDANDAAAGAGGRKDGLGTIAEENASEDEEQTEEEEDDEDEEEEDEEEDEDLDDDSEEEEEEDEEEEEVGLVSEQLSGSRSRSWEEDQNDEEDDDDDNSADELSQDNEDLTQDDDEEEEELEMDEGLDDVQVTAVPKHVTCEEDDVFVSMFDKMLNDNIAESRRAAPGPGQGNIVAPMHMKQKKNYDQIQSENAPEDTIQFSVLLKKNNKPSYKEVAVPIDSEIALNLHKQEEADRIEKERVKKLTLEINERQEEEDLNEAIAQMQRPTLVNTNRRSNTKDRHQKGAPDADLIFGGNKKLPR